MKGFKGSIYKNVPQQILSEIVSSGFVLASGLASAVKISEYIMKLKFQVSSIARIH